MRDDAYDEEVVGSVVDDLAQRGLVDDERFAEVLGRTLASGRGYGRSRIARELSRHGLDDALVDQTLEAAAPLDDEHERAVVEASRLTRGRKLDVSKLAGRLARRGFSPGVAFSVAREVVGGGESDAAAPEEL